jgi:hypothetical protein
MTDQERQLIESLAARLRNAPAPEINTEADELIRRTIGSIPNALYILTQTVLLQELALNQAKAQNAPSFLGGAAKSGNWGRDGRLPQQDMPPERPPANQYTGGGYRNSAYQTGVSPVPPPIPQQPQPGGGWVAEPQSRTSSFLQSAAQTAAGVVAGEMAFSALSSLFGGHHGGGFLGGGGWGDSWGGGGVHETIINNNYFDESPSHHENASFDNDQDSFLTDASDQDDDTSFDDGSDSIDI